jgi:hypothetical protein
MAPLNETSTVGVLLLADDELLADFSLPLTVIKEPAVPPEKREMETDSLFRPRTLPVNPSDDGVLTAIEVHEGGHVQLTFACAEGIRSWRVMDEYPLKDWPLYVDRQITANYPPGEVADKFGKILFPENEDRHCETGNCAAAASLFDSWTRRVANAKRPPTLLVQALPFGKDASLTPVMLPVGVLRVPSELVDQPEALRAEALAAAPDGTPPTPTSPEPVSEPALENSRLDDLSASSAGEASGTADVQDPADPDFEVNRYLPVLDLAAPRLGGPAPAGPPADGVGSTPVLAAQQDPADPDFEINRDIYTVLDPIAPQASRIYPLQSSDGVEGDERTPSYLAYNVVASVPHHKPIAAAARSCVDAWTILLPPPEVETAEKRNPKDSALIMARGQMRTLLNIWGTLARDWKARLPTFQYALSLAPLNESEPKQEKRTGAWLILSHYDNGSLRMPVGNDLVQSVGENPKRELAPPGVVLLLACETAVPAPHSFLASLIDKGKASALISSMAPLPGDAAGQFVTAFIGVLGEAGPDGISVADAFRAALRRLPQYLQDTVPRFVLAGDPSVRLCAPPLVR